ncbi:MauE/DoxX family redox-associated membrane protein [Yinghuangia seranimata]|uniref:MauE/DoxX family redox-associated membrane protein n=1 Tax=Yinghuangia seranimata TaxID=408067 RepID=UPI00248ACBA3|nr:MauE/DoxX family redox-associated membrane protein [Yinghuangia seranimata]MDI2126244.1 MauE/DoxX family redox-associated membrane protein [Yinghuangia seranimata]
MNAAIAARPAGGSTVRRALPWIGLVVRLGLAAVWTFAGWEKATNPAQAAQAVRAFDVLPESLVEPVGYALPYLELGLAALLIIGLGTRIVAGISALLLLVFIAGISQAWARGLAIDCGCFGGGGPIAPDQTKYLQEILRDIGFLAMAGWLLFFPRTRFSADAWLAIEDDDTH